MDISFMIYANTKSLHEKMRTCDNNPKKSSTKNVSRQTVCGYSSFSHFLFDKRKNMSTIEVKIV